MYVSLCAIRLEIADNQPLLTHLDYTAPDMDGQDNNGKWIENATANDKSSDKKDQSNGSPPGSSIDTAKKQRLQHRGRRDLHEITIETFCHSDGEASGSGEKQSPNQKTDKFSSEKKQSSKPLPPYVNFFSGNPFVDITKGILHFYKENSMTATDAEKTEMLCMISVPAAMASHDLLQFTAPCACDIRQLRIIRDGTPNQYMVLIKFQNATCANEFYRTFNGVRFNSMEPEECHLAFVSKVETTRESDLGSMPMDGHTELPICPVCLERMDESVDGILTILCNHSFHGSCLAKWGDTSCPVCRYCQTPEAVADNYCFECRSQESLWICLICGHIGCGRYVGQHAYKHFLETQHTYAMQLGNNRVWDYAGDNYVHRLVQNKADGKLVELNEGQRNGMENDEKLDSIQLEYTYLLTSQLESQRVYYEEKIARVEKDSSKELGEIKERAKMSVDELQETKDKLNSVTRDKILLDKKIALLTKKQQEIALKLKEEEEMNKCLRVNQSAWQSKVDNIQRELIEIKTTKDQEVADLREQLRDVMFYMDAQQKIQSSTDDSLRQDIQEGSVVGISPSAAEGGSKQRRKKR